MRALRQRLVGPTTIKKPLSGLRVALADQQRGERRGEVVGQARMKEVDTDTIDDPLWGLDDANFHGNWRTLQGLYLAETAQKTQRAG